MGEKMSGGLIVDADVEVGQEFVVGRLVGEIAGRSHVDDGIDEGVLTLDGRLWSSQASFQPPAVIMAVVSGRRAPWWKLGGVNGEPEHKAGDWRAAGGMCSGPRRQFRRF